MNLNTRLLLKINSLSGKNQWLDAFGRAGAEFVIIAMGAWYVVAAMVARAPDWNFVFWPLVFLFATWLVAWGLDLLVAEIVREPRPAVTHTEVKLLFKPLMNWKSFPSDHAMSAWLIVFMAFMFNLPGAEGLILLALWVSFGRVYAGVHYPLDIVGGFSIALASSIASYAILIRI